MASRPLSLQSNGTAPIPEALLRPWPSSEAGLTSGTLGAHLRGFAAKGLFLLEPWACAINQDLKERPPCYLVAPFPGLQLHWPETQQGAKC